jgi:hypothetical protein
VFMSTSVKASLIVGLLAFSVMATAHAQNFFNTTGGWIVSCATLACIPSVIKGNVDATADNLKGDAKELYVEVMDDFITNRLPQLLSQVDVLASKHEQVVQALLNNVHEISDSVLEGIRNGIKDVSKLVDRAFALSNAFVDKIACDVEGSVVQATQDASNLMDNILERWKPRFFQDNCEKQYASSGLGIHQPANSVAFANCEIQRWIANSDYNTLSTIQVRNQYADLSDLVFVLQCLPHSTAEQMTLRDEQAKITAEFAIWNGALGENR